MYEQLRSNRLLVSRQEAPKRHSEATIFLGLYNAMPYIESLEAQISSQQEDIPLVVVDNCSDDETWSSIQSWLGKFNRSVILARNPVNLGGTGTMLANMDLVNTEWVITLHQDDFYLPNHVKTLTSAISDAETDVLAFSTEMLSMDQKGQDQAPPPRASWFLHDDSPETMFLANLRLHNFPFPAAAFRVEALESGAGPWHSNVFPDTEMVLRWAMRGNLVHLSQQTMKYRENPLSESHSVQTGEKMLGTYLPLSRVINSIDFHSLLVGVAPDSRDKFFSFFEQSIRIRLGENYLADLVILQAAEIAGFSWTYASERVNNILVQYASDVGATRSLDLLTELSEFYGLGIGASDLKPKFNRGVETSSSKKKMSSRHILRMMSILPDGLRKPTYTRLIKLYSAIFPKTEWNSAWTK